MKIIKFKQERQIQMSALLRSYMMIFSLLLLTSLFIQSCGNDHEKTGLSSAGENSDLLRTEGEATYINAVYRPKEGAIFRYKVVAETNSKEKSPMTDDKEVSTQQRLTYFYTQEVDNINTEGTVTYRMNFDSINITQKFTLSDSTVSEVYNSNVKDSIYNLPDYIQYNALINESFYVRVSKDGEMLDVYGLEKIHDNIYKALGDTLQERDKAMVRETFGKDAILAIVQNQFQMFPGSEIKADSAWTRSYETSLMVFPVRNNLSYTVTGIEEINGSNVLTIEAKLGIDFIEKEVKERDLKYNIEKSEAGGTGTIVFDLSRGCIVTKNTSTGIDIEAKLSARGQSVKSVQNLTTNLTVELLDEEPQGN